ncbi:hypothetical protein GWI33_003809 [Rhynchophorus ferrugineus]|uniref:Uncharacterized protein n=1 Tax=Rhynchophorus ferrugineus TaxID=354439 RepID=A0A834LXS1_RHYFE|nr:hypothetical protein GWI33_003809 [Rhynchophorus ferrugineus]
MCLFQLELHQNYDVHHDGLLIFVLQAVMIFDCECVSGRSTPMLYPPALSGWEKENEDDGERETGDGVGGGGREVGKEGGVIAAKTGTDDLYGIDECWNGNRSRIYLAGKCPFRARTVHIVSEDVLTYILGIIKALNYS